MERYLVVLALLLPGSTTAQFSANDEAVKVGPRDPRVDSWHLDRARLTSAVAEAQAWIAVQQKYCRNQEILTPGLIGSPFWWDDARLQGAKRQAMLIHGGGMVSSTENPHRPIREERIRLMLADSRPHDRIEVDVLDLCEQVFGQRDEWRHEISEIISTYVDRVFSVLTARHLLMARYANALFASISEADADTFATIQADLHASTARVRQVFRRTADQLLLNANESERPRIQQIILPAAYPQAWSPFASESCLDTLLGREDLPLDVRGQLEAFAHRLQAAKRHFAAKIVALLKRVDDARAVRKREWNRAKSLFSGSPKPETGEDELELRQHLRAREVVAAELEADFRQLAPGMPDKKRSQGTVQTEGDFPRVARTNGREPPVPVTGSSHSWLTVAEFEDGLDVLNLSDNEALIARALFGEFQGSGAPLSDQDIQIATASFPADVAAELQGALAGDDSVLHQRARDVFEAWEMVRSTHRFLTDVAIVLPESKQEEWLSLMRQVRWRRALAQTVSAVFEGSTGVQQEYSNTVLGFRDLYEEQLDEQFETACASYVTAVDAILDQIPVRVATDQFKLALISRSEQPAEELARLLAHRIEALNDLYDFALSQRDGLVRATPEPIRARLHGLLDKQQFPFLFSPSLFELLWREMDHYAITNGALKEPLEGVRSRYRQRYSANRRALAKNRLYWLQPAKQDDLREFIDEAMRQRSDGRRLGSATPYDHLWYERRDIVRDACRRVGRMLDTLDERVPPSVFALSHW